MTTDDEQLLREMWCAYTLHATPPPFSVREAMAAVLAVVRAHDSAPPTALANSGPKERQEAFDALKEDLDAALADLAALRIENEQRRLWQEDAVLQCAKRGCASLHPLLEDERLRAENAEAELAALRADAERYRWLRDQYTVRLLNGEHELRITHGPRANSNSGIDDAIDAARGGT